MRDLQADIDYINEKTATDELAICKEYLHRAIAAEAEVAKLKQQIYKMRCCDNCKNRPELICYCDEKSIWEWEG